MQQQQIEEMTTTTVTTRTCTTSSAAAVAHHVVTDLDDQVNIEIDDLVASYGPGPSNAPMVNLLPSPPREKSSTDEITLTNTSTTDQDPHHSSNGNSPSSDKSNNQTNGHNQTNGQHDSNGQDSNNNHDPIFEVTSLEFPSPQSVLFTGDPKADLATVNLVIDESFDRLMSTVDPYREHSLKQQHSKSLRKLGNSK